MSFLVAFVRSPQTLGKARRGSAFLFEPGNPTSKYSPTAKNAT
jgi:hypothetical protein